MTEEKNPSNPKEFSLYFFIRLIIYPLFLFWIIMYFLICHIDVQVIVKFRYMQY